MVEWIVPIFTALFGGALVKLLDRKKTRAETELTEVQQAEITAHMALEFAQQKDEFYQVQLKFLQAEVEKLRSEVDMLQLVRKDQNCIISQLRDEIGELRKMMP